MKRIRKHKKFDSRWKQHKTVFGYPVYQVIAWVILAIPLTAFAIATIWGMFALLYMMTGVI